MGAGLLQPPHIIFVIVIALLVFGPKRLPEMGRSIGNGIREFKDSMDGTGPSDGGVQTHETSTASVPQEPTRVAALPPAGPPPAAAPPVASSAPAPAAARSGSVSR
jgi:sec-independent protein translocase protein TatA